MTARNVLFCSLFWNIVIIFCLQVKSLKHNHAHVPNTKVCETSGAVLC
jgi:hypothetical protein